MSAPRPMTTVVLVAALAMPAAAQSPAPADSAPTDAWTLLRELPIQARVTVTNPMSESVTATVSYVADDRVVLTDHRVEANWNGSRPRGQGTLTVSRGDVARVSIVKMPKSYRLPDGSNNRAPLRHVVAAYKTGARLQLRLNDGTSVRGLLMSSDAQSVTLAVDETPQTVALSDMRGIEPLGLFSKGAKIALIGGGVGFTTMSIIAAILGSR